MQRLLQTVSVVAVDLAPAPWVYLKPSLHTFGGMRHSNGICAHRSYSVAHHTWGYNIYRHANMETTQTGQQSQQGQLEIFSNQH